MKKIWIFTGILLFFSCSVSKKVNNERQTDYVEGLRKEFKIVFFRDCLASKGKYPCEVLRNDRSTSSDFSLGLYNYKLIDTLVEMVKQEIYADSVAWTNQLCKDCDEETLERMWNNGMIGKKTLKFCLDYYTSSELDSIAKARILK